MTQKSLHTSVDTVRRWIEIANLLAEEPQAPTPNLAERALLDRVVGRLRQIPLRNWPPGLLGRNPGSTMSLRTEADAEIDTAAVYDLVYSITTALVKILAGFSDPDLAQNGHTIAWLPHSFVGQAVLLEASGRMQTLPRGDYAQFLNDLELLDDARRIRRCQVCPRFFFADRRDHSACSPTHAHTLSMRKWRDSPQGKDYALGRKIDLYQREERTAAVYTPMRSRPVAPFKAKTKNAQSRGVKGS
jgi:hypothetical protein